MRTRKDYDIGYRKPPKETRFQKGRSGNPSGRPRKSTDLQKLLSAELERIVSLKIGDKTKRVSKREAIITSIVNGALRLEPRCINLVFNLMKNAPSPEPFGTSPDEAEDLRRALQVIKNLSKPGEE